MKLKAWRAVEAQHITSTRKLVASYDEQARLERLIDGVKPPVPPDIDVKTLHWLLSTPFRHPPLPYGSRFGRRHERGVFYASREVPTVLAEVAYYRWVFLAGSEADLGLLETEHTIFQVGISLKRGVDLSAPPFSEFEPVLRSATDYGPTQRLGSAMREAGIQGALYVSARAPGRGISVALFEPAFSPRQPLAQVQVWLCSATEGSVEFKRKNVLDPDAERREFLREDFLVKGVLPSPSA